MLAQPLAEGVEEVLVSRRRLGAYKGDACTGGRLLRLGRTMRRKNEADSENDRKSDHPQAHLAGGWLAGSLAERRDVHKRGDAGSVVVSRAVDDRATRASHPDAGRPRRPESRSPVHSARAVAAQTSRDSAEIVEAVGVASSLLVLLGARRAHCCFRIMSVADVAHEIRC